ncbi:MAG: hypothetical protein V4498_05320 [candidate division FCPU426 bacterium]
MTPKKVFYSLVLLLTASTLSAGWYSKCPDCEQKLGGNSLIGPYEKVEDCRKQVEYYRGIRREYIDCYEDGSSTLGADSGLGSGTSEILKSSGDAISFGLVHGSGESIGLGLMGVGVAGVLQGSKTDPARQAEQIRQQQEGERQAKAQEAERKKKFEAEKSDMLAEMEGKPDLKDAVADGPMELKKLPTRKPFHPPKLKPVVNPLYKDPLPGDSQAAKTFEDWEKAKAHAKATHGTFGKESTGRIVCCPAGFPFVCGNLCFSAAAFNDYRIPCDSKLLTMKPED